MKKGIAWIITSLLLVSMFALPIKASGQTELERLQDFMKDHPTGGTFTLQQDLVVEADVVLNTKGATYQLECNGYQIQMMSWSSLTSCEGQAWWDAIPYPSASFVIEGDASKQPLIVVYGEAYFNNVEVNARNGTAVLVEKGCFNVGNTMENGGFYSKISTTNGVALTLSEEGQFHQTDDSTFECSATNGIAIDVYGMGFFGEDKKATTVIAKGDQSVGVRYHIPYDQDRVSPALTNVDIQVEGDNAVGISAPWLSISDLNISTKGSNALVYDIPNLDRVSGAVILNGASYQTFDIQDSQVLSAIPVPNDMAFETVPFPTMIYTDVYQNGEKISESYLHVEFDKAQFQAGMATGKPFVMSASLCKEEAISYQVKPGVSFTVEIQPNTQPPFALYFQKNGSDDFILKMERPYDAQHVYIYQSEDNQSWGTPVLDYVGSFESSSKQLPTPYISLNSKALPANMHYLKVEIVGGYLDGKSSSFNVKQALYGDDDSTVETPPSGEDKDDGGHSGNEGQGGGRGESNYQPEKPSQPTTPSDTNQDIPSDTILSKVPVSNPQQEEEPIIKESAQQKEPWEMIFLMLCIGALGIRYRKMFSIK